MTAVGTAGSVAIGIGGTSSAGGPSGPYVTTATRVGFFGGIQNYFGSTSGLASNSYFITVSLSMRSVWGNNYGDIMLFANRKNAVNSNECEIVRVNSYKTLDANTRNTAGTTLHSSIKNSPNFTQTDGLLWKNYIVTLRSDQLTSAISMSKNGVDVSLSTTTIGATGLMRLVNGEFATGSSFGYALNSSGNPYIEVANVWCGIEQVDPVADYSKFFDPATHKPIYLGSDGSEPTGRQPEHFAPDGDLTNNLGTQPNFTAVGTPITASTSPTD